MASTANSIQGDLERLEMDFLDALVHENCRKPFIERLECLLKSVKSFIGDGSFSQSTSLQIRAVSSSLIIIARAFQALGKIKGKGKAKPTPNYAPARSFILKRLHSPFPSPNQTKTLSQLCNIDEESLKEWFRATRKKLGYQRLCKELCNGDGRQFKRHLRHVLYSPTASGDIPDKIKTALLDLRARALELLSHPIPKMETRRSLIAKMDMPNTRSLCNAEFENPEKNLSNLVLSDSTRKSCSGLIPQETKEEVSKNPMCLNFVEPLTPNSMNRLTSGCKRKREDSEECGTLFTKIRRQDQLRPLQRETVHPDNSSWSSTPGEENLFVLPTDFANLFDPTSFQGCDVSWFEQTAPNSDISCWTDVSSSFDMVDATSLFDTSNVFAPTIHGEESDFNSFMPFTSGCELVSESAPLTPHTWAPYDQLNNLQQEGCSISSGFDMFF